MGFEQAPGSFSDGESIKANQLAIGQFIEGYIIGRVDSTKFPGSFAFKFSPTIENDFLGLKIGKEAIVWANGSLRKFYESGNVDGYLYRITRTKGVISKTYGKETVSFAVQVDKTKKYEAAIPVDEIKF